MAITAGEAAQLVALATREGGLKPLVDQMQAAYTASANAGAVTALNTAIVVTVPNWQAVLDYVAAPPSNLTIKTVMGDIVKASGSRDASKLGPLFAALFAANKRQLGM